MISYKYDREHGLTRGTVRETTDGGPGLAVAGAPAFPGPARDGAGLTRRRVVDFCRVTAAL
jgi:hypothetical protein